MTIRWYVLGVAGDVEPFVYGPFASERDRDAAALAVRRTEGEDDGVYALDVPAGGRARAFSYGGAYMETHTRPRGGTGPAPSVPPGERARIAESLRAIGRAECLGVTLTAIAASAQGAARPHLLPAPAPGEPLAYVVACPLADGGEPFVWSFERLDDALDYIEDRQTDRLDGPIGWP